MTDPKRVVADGYDRLHPIYDGWTSGRHSLRLHYIDRVFDLGLSLPATALDLGCSTGRHATAYLVARGLDVIGVDISRRSVEVAQREVPQAHFLVADMASVSFAANTFDLVTAFYSIIHVPMEEQPALFSGIASWTRPGGFLVATLAGGDVPTTEHAGRWLGVAPMYWSGWDAATNRRMVQEAGFELVDDRVVTTVEDGDEVRFLWLVARRVSGA